MANVSFMPTSKLLELLRITDAQSEMFVQVTQEGRLALGIDPLHPTHLIDLSREKIILSGAKFGPVDKLQVTTTPEVRIPISPRKRARRTSGNYWYEMNEQRISCGSLPELLSKGLRELEKFHPGMLDNLSNIKPRSRRIVARNPSDLFDKTHLAKDHAEQLLPGWWYGTNNSARETQTWLKRACSLSGLNWGREFRTNLEN